ncbi:MAG: hypothetical protein L6437_13845 [Kiritimatiellae bacterium]|nr:hypothetical protein [Kiritimatiellia bacterium]
MEENKKQPISKKQTGRFQITVWKNHKIVPGDEHGFIPEREYDIVRTCIQYSKFNRLTRQYDRQQIWCNPMELRDLFQALGEPGQNSQSNGGPR